MTPERTSALHAETPFEAAWSGVRISPGPPFIPPSKRSSVSEKSLKIDCALSVVHMSLDQSSIPGLGKGRLEALTDGIFATVMTVLALSLSVPAIASSISRSQLSSEVVVDIEALWPNILGYVLSFLLLAVLWISHP